MSQTDVLANKLDSNDKVTIEPYFIDYEKLIGRGGAFLITPLGHGAVAIQKREGASRGRFGRASRHQTKSGSASCCWIWSLRAQRATHDDW